MLWNNFGTSLGYFGLASSLAISLLVTRTPCHLLSVFGHVFLRKHDRKRAPCLHCLEAHLPLGLRREHTYPTFYGPNQTSCVSQRDIESATHFTVPNGKDERNQHFEALCSYNNSRKLFKRHDWYRQLSFYHCMYFWYQLAKTQLIWI